MNEELKPIPIDEVIELKNDLNEPIPIEDVRPLGKYDIVNNKIIPTNENEKQNYEKTILQSAGEDVKEVAKGFWDLGKGVVKTALFPKETAIKFFNYIEQESKAGRLDDDLKNFAMGFLEPFKNIGRLGGELVGEAVTEPSKIPETIEKEVLRRPASFTLDLTSVTGGIKALTNILESSLGVKVGKTLVKKGGSLATGIPEESIIKRIEQNYQIINARPYEQIASDIPNAFEVLQSKIKNNLENAYNSLDKVNKTYDKKIIINTIKSKADEIKAFGEVDKQAKQSLLGYIERLKDELKDTKQITAKDIKEIIKSYDEDIRWTGEKYSDKLNSKLAEIRRDLDTIIKTDSPEYAKYMEDVHDLVDLKIKTKKVLGVKETIGEGYNIEEARMTKKIADLNKQFKENDIKTMIKFGEETGLNIPAESMFYKIKQDFEKSYIQGSRRTMAGAAIGSTIGGIAGEPQFGAGVGAATGYILDKWGSKLLAAGIDKGSNIYNSFIKIADKIPQETQAATLVRGFIKEKEDHPDLDDETIAKLVLDEIKKDKKFYEKNK